MREKFLVNIPEKLSGLVDIAYNLWWSWHPEARMLFKTINRVVWKESGHNPIRMLGDLPKDTLRVMQENEDYLRMYDDVLAGFNRDIEKKVCWFTEHISGAGCKPIAYFSAEYGLHHSLPFYAGGLGFLAGDFIKECSDLGVPIVAVGFLYPEGYLRQKIGMNGWQETVDDLLDREAAPIQKVLDEKGDQLTVKVPFLEPPVYVALWKVEVGGISIYLMDADIEINEPWNRTVAYHLYAGDIEQRLRQEIVLGIGGIAALKALGIRHSLLHLNEGHCAFALLERIRERIEDDGMSFEDALKKVRDTTVFTTHTPVPAGHDVFPYHLMDKYFSRCYPYLGLDRDAFLRLGIHPDEPDSGFNMTAFCLKMSNYHNAVSKRHGEVARRMWHSLWPDKKGEDVPVDSITNGIHVPTWIEPKMQLLFDKYLGKHWLEEHDNHAIWQSIDNIPDKELWDVHSWLKVKLINYIRERARRRWTINRVNPLHIITSGTLLDTMTLTIGFARRFVGYKRADLIFYDLDRLKKILTDRWRPIQIIFAGKAHTTDDEGKRILQKIIQFANDPALGGRIAFVENYDEQLAQYMVHGVDLWLNNPVPPLEACGTSGMKASLNGVPHLSILDGWWREGFNGKNGWAFEGKGNDEDAGLLYDLLENEIIPIFYKLDETGTPADWVKVMKQGMKSNGPAFSARRMVKEYATKFYQHALKS